MFNLQFNSPTERRIARALRLTVFLVLWPLVIWNIHRRFGFGKPLVAIAIVDLAPAIIIALLYFSRWILVSLLRLTDIRKYVTAISWRDWILLIWSFFAIPIGLSLVVTVGGMLKVQKLFDKEGKHMKYFIVLLLLGGHMGLAIYLTNLGFYRSSIYVSGIYAAIALLVPLMGFYPEDGKPGFLLQKLVYGNPLTVLLCSAAFSLWYGCIYRAVSLWRPEQFEGIKSWGSAMYFSVVTITTVGYGDILPIQGIGKALCVIEIGSGVLFFLLCLNAATTAWLERQKKNAEKSSAMH